MTQFHLLPCPFCGGVASWNHNDGTVLIDGTAGAHWIDCDDCGASTNLRYSLMEDCRPLLAEQWNRRTATPEPEKIAPVQGWPAGIPWSLHMEAYAAYSKKWSPQPAMIDLEGRNCRGGFSVGELDDFIPGWRDKVSEITKLRAEVAALKQRLETAQTNPTTWARG